MQQHRISLGGKPRTLQLHPIELDRRQGARAVAPAIPGQGNALRPQPCAGIQRDALPHLAGEPGEFQRALAQAPGERPGRQAQRHGQTQRRAGEEPQPMAPAGEQAAQQAQSKRPRPAGEPRDLLPGHLGLTFHPDPLPIMEDVTQPHTA